MTAIATIASTTIHWGFPTVWVAEYATTDMQGRACIVDKFFRDGGTVTCKGWLLRKDGTRYNRYQVLLLAATPDNVLEALEALEAVA